MEGRGERRGKGGRGGGTKGRECIPVSRLAKLPGLVLSVMLAIVGVRLIIADECEICGCI